jgi:hypothetical protein
MAKQVIKTDFIEFIEHHFDKESMDLIKMSLYALLFVYMKKNGT